jgi:hypothetical protein
VPSLPGVGGSGTLLSVGLPLSRRTRVVVDLAAAIVPTVVVAVLVTMSIVVVAHEEVSEIPLGDYSLWAAAATAVPFSTSTHEVANARVLRALGQQGGRGRGVPARPCSGRFVTIVSRIRVATLVTVSAWSSTQEAR